MTTLTEHIADLEPVIRDNISAIWIESGQGGRLQARCSISLMLRVGDGGAALVEIDPAPEGVTASGWERADDVVRDLDPLASVEDQIRDLHDSRLVGGLDASRVSSDDGPVRWLVKTHAGSDAERREWATRR